MPAGWEPKGCVLVPSGRVVSFETTVHVPTSSLPPCANKGCTESERASKASKALGHDRCMTVLLRVEPHLCAEQDKQGDWLEPAHSQLDDPMVQLVALQYQRRI